MNAQTSENLIENFTYTKDELVVNWQDGKQSRLLAMWLRDHCQMPKSRNLTNGQRLLNISDIPENLTIFRVEQQDHGSLAITFAPEQHRSVFTQHWLRANCYCLNAQYDDRSEAAKILWQADSFAGRLPVANYAAYRADNEAKLKSLQAVIDYGFTLLTGVPCEAGEVLNVIRTFGFCRETNYGPLFDVRSVIDPNNLAFTNMGLGCHADNPYRDPVPTVQVLHCLASSTEGGDSVLVDGFKAAAVLRDEYPEDFDLLTRQYLNFRFADVDTELRARVPMIELDDRGKVVKIRYNNRSIDTVRIEPSLMPAFYRSYRHFAGILERPELKIIFKMNPGDLIILDNTRIMHARTGFSAGGKRHLQGAYSDLDGLYSTLLVLKRRQ